MLSIFSAPVFHNLLGYLCICTRACIVQHQFLFVEEIRKNSTEQSSIVVHLIQSCSSDVIVDNNINLKELLEKGVYSDVVLNVR